MEHIGRMQERRIVKTSRDRSLEIKFKPRCSYMKLTKKEEKEEILQKSIHPI